MTAPVFIEIRKYRSVLDKIDALKDHLNELHVLVSEVNELRDEEKKQIDIAHQRIAAMTQSISVVEEEV